MPLLIAAISTLAYYLVVFLIDRKKRQTFKLRAAIQTAMGKKGVIETGAEYPTAGIENSASPPGVFGAISGVEKPVVMRETSMEKIAKKFPGEERGENPGTAPAVVLPGEGVKSDHEETGTGPGVEPTKNLGIKGEDLAVVLESENPMDAIDEKGMLELVAGLPGEP